MQNDLITADEAAKFLRVSAGTLAIWRSNKRYPLPYVKIGHLVYYRQRDLERFIESRVMNMPPDEPEPTTRVSRKKGETMKPRKQKGKT